MFAGSFPNCNQWNANVHSPAETKDLPQHLRKTVADRGLSSGVTGVGERERGVAGAFHVKQANRKMGLRHRDWTHPNWDRGDLLLASPILKKGNLNSTPKWLWLSKPMGSHFGVGAPPILVFWWGLGCSLGVRDFDHCHLGPSQNKVVDIRFPSNRLEKGTCNKHTQVTLVARNDTALA